MNSENIYRCLKIDEESITPKYLQIANSVLHAVEINAITKDYLLPSINDLSYELEISRDTANAKERLQEAHKLMGITNHLSAQLEGIFNQWANIRITDREVKKLVQMALVPML